MSATEEAETMIDAAEDLVESIKTENLSLLEARNLVHIIRETEGWLISARKLLNPEEPGRKT